MEKYIRLSLSADGDGNIEVFSCVTRTTLLLPEVDRELLIASLSNFHQTVSEREILSLDPSLEICGI